MHCQNNIAIKDERIILGREPGEVGPPPHSFPSKQTVELGKRK